jgi:adenine/guanine phosphoribosyltransferase-like PRPP-binding protein
VDHDHSIAYVGLGWGRGGRVTLGAGLAVVGALEAPALVGPRGVDLAATLAAEGVWVGAALALALGVALAGSAAPSVTARVSRGS